MPRHLVWVVGLLAACGGPSTPPGETCADPCPPAGPCEQDGVCDPDTGACNYAPLATFACQRHGHLVLSTRAAVPPFDLDVQVDDAAAGATCEILVDGALAASGCSAKLPISSSGVRAIAARVTTGGGAALVGPVLVTADTPRVIADLTVDSTGGTLTTSATESQFYPDVVLEVPPGAVSAPTTITISEFAELRRDGMRGPVLQLEPSGATFAVPLQLRARHPAGEAEAPCAMLDRLTHGTLVSATTAEPLRVTDVDCATREVTLAIPHFSWLGLAHDILGALPEPLGDPDFPIGQYAYIYDELIDPTKTVLDRIEKASTIEELVTAYLDQDIAQDELDGVLDQAIDPGVAVTNDQAVALATTFLQIHQVMRNGVSPHNLAAALELLRYYRSEDQRYEAVKELLPDVIEAVADLAELGKFTRLMGLWPNETLDAIRRWDMIATYNQYVLYQMGRADGDLDWNEQTGTLDVLHNDGTYDIFPASDPRNGWFSATTPPSALRHDPSHWSTFEILYRAQSTDHAQVIADYRRLLDRVATLARERTRASAVGWTWGVATTPSTDRGASFSSDQLDVAATAAITAVDSLHVDLSTSAGTPSFVSFQVRTGESDTVILDQQRSTGRSGLTYQTPRLPPGHYLVRATAVVDGISHRLNIALEVAPAAAPQVSFVTPSGDARWDGRQPFAIAVAASDAEDGVLPPSSMRVRVRSGDLDRLYLRDDHAISGAFHAVLPALPDGDYQLVAEALDSSGQSGTATARLSVGPCLPDCTGHDCGDNGCGGSCGVCSAPADVCANATTVTTCTAAACVQGTCQFEFSDLPCACGGTCDPATGICGPLCSSWPMVRHDARQTGRGSDIATGGPSIAWSATLASLSYSGPVIADDGTALVSTQNGVQAFDRSGALRWTYATSAVPVTASPTVDAAGLVAVPAGAHMLRLRRSDGTLAADQALPYPAASTAILGPDGTLYFFASDSTPHLLGIDPSGAVIFDGLFTGQGGTPLSSTTPAVAADGRVFVHAYARLWAFAPTGGNLWDIACSGESPAVLADDGTIIALTDQNSLRAVDPAGASRWEVDLQHDSPYHRGAPALAPDGDIWVAGGVDLGGGSHGLRVTKHALASGAVTESATQSTGAAGANTNGGLVVDADGVVYVHAAVTYAATGHILSAFTGGRLRWTVGLGGDRETQETRAAAIAGDGRIVVTSADQHLVAIGARALGAPCPACTPAPGWPMARADGSRRARSSGSVSTSGVVERWPAVGASGTGSSPVAAGGRVYHVARDLRAIEPATGAVAWTVPLTGTTARSPAVASGRVYVPDDSGVHAIDEQGATLWSLPGLAPGELLLAPSGDLVFRYGGHLYVVAASGAIRFGVYVSDSGGQAVADDGTVVACAGSDLIGLDAAGVPRWTRSLPGAGCEPTVDGDRVLVHSSDGQLRAIDRSTGADLWTRPTGLALTLPVAVSAAGTAHVAGVGGDQLRVMAVTSGNALAWSYQETVTTIDGPQVEGAPVVDADGTVVFNLGRNSCYSGIAYTCRALELTAVTPAGVRPWTVTTGGAPLGDPVAPPAVGTDGTIYVAGGDGKLHAFH